MIRLISIIVLTIVSIPAFSQSDSVITLQGDTLSGNAIISANNNMVQTITLKKDKKKVHFKAYEVKSLIMDEKIYHTIKIQNLYQLGLLQKEGYLSWYKYMDSQETSSRDFSASILIKRDGTHLIVPNLGLKKQLKKYLGDCNIVSEKISESAYKRSELGKIVDDYNKCIDENTLKINAQKTKKNLITDKSKEIDILITSIKEDGSLDDLRNTIEMLTDLRKKYNEGSTIPSYLKAALRASLESNSDFTEQLSQILE